MKRIYLFLAALFVLCGTVPAFAQAGASVLCQGNICGGSGIRNYQYEITMTEGTLQQFHVGTCDPDIADYSNWLMPTGWSAAIFSIPELHNPAFTPHGGLSTPLGSCQWSVVFTGPGVQNAVLGFDNSHVPHDVGWFINSGAPSENWAAPVGMGAGPVHGPTPEPASLCVLATALAGLALRRRR